MKQRKIPEDVEINCLGSGCPNNCWYCYDGGYPDSKDDFLYNKRFDGKRFWKYEDIVSFRALCRKHDQKVLRKGTDPEYKKPCPNNQMKLMEHK